MDNRLASNARTVPISEEYLESFHKCLEIVSRGRKYLEYVKPPSLKSNTETVLSNP
jgi:hypothetical protein